MSSKVLRVEEALVVSFRNFLHKSKIVGVLISSAERHASSKSDEKRLAEIEILEGVRIKKVKVR